MGRSSLPAAAGGLGLLDVAGTMLDEGGRDSLSQRAYAQISRALIVSALRPGHRLILRPLAAELGLSPTPVRKALLRLVSEQAPSLDDRGSTLVATMDRPGRPTAPSRRPRPRRSTSSSASTTAAWSSTAAASTSPTRRSTPRSTASCAGSAARR